jgi:hypothetical protein
MEQFNYHKLINLKKRFDKYDCAISQDILAVIDKHIILEKEKSKEKAAERHWNYLREKVKCEVCDVVLTRRSISSHKEKKHSGEVHEGFPPPLLFEKN